MWAVILIIVLVIGIPLILDFFGIEPPDEPPTTPTYWDF